MNRESAPRTVLSIGGSWMAGARCRGLTPFLSSLQGLRMKSVSHCRGGHSGVEAWEDSVEVDRDPSVARRFGRVLREHKICKSAPEWLPFVPGSCYWLPPEELTVLPSEAFGFVRDLSDREVRDVVKRLRITPKLPMNEEVVVIVDGISAQDLDEKLENIVKSFWNNKQGG